MQATGLRPDGHGPFTTLKADRSEGMGPVGEPGRWNDRYAARRPRGARREGQAQDLFQERQRVLQRAYTAHPERFVKGPPQPPALPSAVWINPPQPGQKVRLDTPELH